MPIVQSLREALIRDEGLRLKPYRDVVGKLTIGVGRNLDDRGITMAEAELLLTNDLAETTAAVRQALPWADTLDPVRQAVLVNMAFNLGVQGLLGFRKTLELVNEGRYVEAAAEMLKSAWAGQVGSRADRLALQMESGRWV